MNWKMIESGTSFHKEEKNGIALKVPWKNIKLVVFSFLHAKKLVSTISLLS